MHRDLKSDNCLLTDKFNLKVKLNRYVCGGLPGRLDILSYYQSAMNKLFMNLLAVYSLLNSHGTGKQAHTSMVSYHPTTHARYAQVADFGTSRILSAVEAPFGETRGERRKGSRPPTNSGSLWDSAMVSYDSTKVTQSVGTPVWQCIYRSAHV